MNDYRNSASSQSRNTLLQTAEPYDFLSIFAKYTNWDPGINVPESSFDVSKLIAIFLITSIRYLCSVPVIEVLNFLLQVSNFLFCSARTGSQEIKTGSLENIK